MTYIYPNFTIHHKLWSFYLFMAMGPMIYWFRAYVLQEQTPQIIIYFIFLSLEALTVLIHWQCTEWHDPLFVKRMQGWSNLSLPFMTGSWQMLHGESMRPWRRRCSPSCLCVLQAVCLAAMCLLPLATAVAIWPLRSPHPSPLPPPSAAARLQVTMTATS